MKEKIAICLIVKDEPEMLPEFIDYYLKLGADSIIIYDNDSTEPVVSENPNVIVHRWPSVWPGNQTKAYYDCAVKYKNEYKWIAFFDTDEYLILKKHNNIKAFLADYDQYPGVGINWLCFGSSDIEIHSSHKDYYKHCRFTNPINTHIKSIVKPENLTIPAPDPHFVVKGTIDTNFNEIYGPFSDFKSDIAYIKHCIMRTKENYISKIKKGDVNVFQKNANFRTESKWDDHYRTFNECQDEKKIWM
jgi:hypothetical protein